LFAGISLSPPGKWRIANVPIFFILKQNRDEFLPFIELFDTFRRFAVSGVLWALLSEKSACIKKI